MFKDTLQLLFPELRAAAIRCISPFVAPDGTLLVITRGREEDKAEGKIPWPLTEEELTLSQMHGLAELSFEDYVDNEILLVRRFRVTYKRK